MRRFRSYTVMVVDDEPDVRLITSLAIDSAPGLKVIEEAASGEQAIERCSAKQPDVVVMDIAMPGMGGEAATEAIVARHPCVNVLAHTGSVDEVSVARMIAAGAIGYAVKGGSPDDLVTAVKRAATQATFIDDAALPGMFSACTTLMQRERHQRRKYEQLAAKMEAMYDDVVLALTSALQLRDEYTGEHDHRVSAHCVEVGRALGLAEQQLIDLEFGGVFHDIGKIGIPDCVLHKTGPLTDSEWSIIKQHTVIGEQILRPISFLSTAGKFVRHSHEHWDGSGYPDRLVGDDIPLESRIIFACDAYDAMTTDRTYQKARPAAVALDTMRALSNEHFDADVVSAMHDLAVV